MGADATGFLVFGINFGADEELPEELEFLTDDFENRLYAAFKEPTDPVEPTEEFPDTNQGFDKPRRQPTPEEQAILTAYHDAWAAKRRVTDAVGVDVLLTGSDSYSGRVLYVKESQLMVEWTETADADAHITSKSDRTASWHETLRACCDRLGLPFDTRPQWLLATRYF